MTFPFPADTLHRHRFHGLIQGAFELEGEYLGLTVWSASIPAQKRGGRPSTPPTNS